MVNNILLSFSFMQGVLAFFAPCAVALLPGYLSSFLTRNIENEKQTKLLLLKRATVFSFLTILGIGTVYGIASIAVLLFASVIKSIIPYIGIVLGVFVIILGIFMLKGKTIQLRMHGPQGKAKSQAIESYLFGISYAIGALACLFPFFLVVATTAVQAETITEGASYLGAYALGMSIFMLGFYILAVFAKRFLQKSVRKIMPYIHRVGGAIIILAGTYIIWYQGRVLL